MNILVTCLVCLCSLFLTRCGVQSIAEATKNAVVTGNITQEEIRKELERTAKLTQALNDLMEKTVSAVHLQVLTVALEQMMSPQNTAVLAPPVRMMPYAQAYAIEASALEIVQMAHILYTDALLSPETEKPFRIASIVALSLLGAFTSDAKFAQIEQTQIIQKGRFELTAYVLFAGRYMALRDYFLGDILDNLPSLNIGTLKDAAGYFQPMIALGRAPYASRLTVSIESLGVQASVTAKELKSVGLRANRRFRQSLAAEEIATPDAAAWLQSFLDV